MIPNDIDDQAPFYKAYERLMDGKLKGVPTRFIVDRASDEHVLYHWVVAFRNTLRVMEPETHEVTFTANQLGQWIAECMRLAQFSHVPKFLIEGRNVGSLLSNHGTMMGVKDLGRIRSYPYKFYHMVVKETGEDDEMDMDLISNEVKRQALDDVREGKDVGIKHAKTRKTLGETTINTETLENAMDHFLEFVEDDETFKAEHISRWVAQVCHLSGIHAPAGLVNVRALGREINTDPDKYGAIKVRKYGNRWLYKRAPM